jgi:transposase
LVFKAVVGNIDNFCHSQQIVKLAGVDLEMKQSGTYRGQEHISKKGSTLLRYALSSAVNIAISKNKKIRQLFLDKLNVLGNTQSAKAKLKIKFIEKYIRIAFTLLKNNVPFNIDCLTVPVREPVHINVRA